MDLAPVALALIVVLAVAAVGGLLAVLRHLARFRSFHDLATDAQKIAKALGGNVFRDGDDLVISGNQGRWPVVVRWSHSETMPGLDIRMEAPASFTLWVTPKSAAATEGRALLRTNGDMFDARFSTRTDHPTQATMLLGGRNVVPAIQKLCSSSQTALAITSGSIELSAQIIPRPNTSKQVLDQLAGMELLADFLKTIPGAERFNIRPIRKEHHIIGRLAIAAGVVAAVLTVVAASSKPPDQPLTAVPSAVPAGVLPLDAMQIANVSNYRLAATDDFDAGAAAWLRGNGVAPSGRLAADFLGSGEPHDTAYLFVDKEGNRRVVLLADGNSKYDIKLTYAGLIARVPKRIIGSINWVGISPQADGDGLLVIRRPDDVKSGLVLFVRGPRIISAVPANYQAINLQ